MKLDMKMKAAVIAAISRRLVQGHDIREGHSPEIVEFNQDRLEDCGEIAHFLSAQFRDVRVGILRCDKNLISVTREIWDEGNRRFIFDNDPPSILALCFENLLKKYALCFLEMELRDTCFSLDRFEDEICRVNLAMRMRVGDTDYFTTVFEDQHVVDFITATEFCILLLPDV